MGIFHNKDNQILLLKRYDNDRTDAGWCLPGGKVDEGESINEALKREVKEEIGIDIVNFQLKGSYLSQVEGRQDFYVYVFKIYDEIKDICLNYDELENYDWHSYINLPFLAGNTMNAFLLNK